MSNILEDLPEYSGKLYELTFNKACAKESNLFTQSTVAVVNDLVYKVLALRSTWIQNLQLTEEPIRDSDLIAVDALKIVNQDAWNIFFAWVRIMAHRGYNPDVLDLKFGEFLDNLNFKEAFATNNPIFSLENFSLQEVHRNSLWFHKQILCYDFSKQLKDLPETQKVEIQGFSRYSHEYLELLNTQVLALLDQCRSLISLEKDKPYNSQGQPNLQSYQAQQNSILIDLSVNVFILFNLGGIKEANLCELYKLNK